MRRGTAASEPWRGGEKRLLRDQLGIVITVIENCSPAAGPVSSAEDILFRGRVGSYDTGISATVDSPDKTHRSGVATVPIAVPP
jgi:hypothetical protein